jgi:hypothetical protein
VTTQGIPKFGAKLRNLATQWLQQNPIAPIDAITVDGVLRVEVTADSMQNSFGHTRYPNKLAVLPAIEPILKHGAYLGHMADLDGKAFENYYFAAPVEIDGERKVVFVRAREGTGSDAQLYVHEVFTEDEIKKADELAAVLSRRPLRGMQTSATTSKNAVNPSDLYRSIIREALDVNTASMSVDANGEPLMQWRQSGADIKAFDPRERDAELSKHNQTHSRNKQ